VYARDRSLYRPEAVQRYLAGAQKGVLPRLLGPRALIFLWLFLGLLLVAGAAAWFAEVPIYAIGQAVVVPAGESGLAGVSSFVVIAFLPSEDLAALHVGQRMLVKFPRRETWITTRTVLPEVSSAAAALQHFGLGVGAARAIARPSAVAIAPLTQWPRGTEPARDLGGIYSAEVQIGTRRLSSLFLAPARAAGG
jgi:hypothetical protein